MGVAAVVHLKVFPAKPYQQGERCIRNVAVMSDYASLGAPPDPEEVRESGRLTKMHLVQPDDRERRLSFPQSVCDVVFGSGEIVCFPMRLSSVFLWCFYIHICIPEKSELPSTYLESGFFFL